MTEASRMNKKDVIHHATLNQHRAADPASSVWVSANAGTGKTRVLTARILRILINGARISEVMGVTYTRAAAAEMRNRIYSTPAKWAVMDESALINDIIALGIERPSQKQINTARSLFAKLLDAPAAIRIETVHAFCQSVLRRFPFEAGIQPYFELATELQAKTLQEDAIADVMSAQDEESQNALARLAVSVAEANLIKPVMAVWRYERVMTHIQNDPIRLKRDLYNALGCVKAADDPEAAIAALNLDLIRPPHEDKLRFFATKCNEGTDAEKKRGAYLTSWLAYDEEERVKDVDKYVRNFLTLKMTVSKQNKPTKALKESYPETEEIFNDEGTRLALIKHQIRAIETANLTSALYQVAGRISASYHRRKTNAGLMDYDDLITNTTSLLKQNGGASWVRYKLDEGITHLLVDEAQDTSPGQWAILKSLAEEFFTGDDGSEQDRSLFSVGDYKQSIYSFQGARPDLFNDQRSRFKDMARQSGKPFDEVDLDTSFRTVAPILRLVDQVMKPAGDEGMEGLPGIGDFPDHVVSRIGDAGFIEIFAPIDSNKTPKTEPYQTYRSGEAEGGNVMLARRITAWLKDRVGTKMIPSKGRVMRAGDVMILLRKRDKFAAILDRELRRSGLPVAAVDRAKLTEEIAVMDLMALGQVMLLPEDDLSLATVLKSPLFGLDEDDLFALAYDRGGKTLQQRLAESAAKGNRFIHVHARLTTWLGLAEMTPPSQFFRAVLTPEVTAAFIARLGANVEKTLAEFLAKTREFEDVNAPSLQKLIAVLGDSEMDIKRENAVSDSDEIRMMTMHGAKGLEAPIVVLPQLIYPSYKAPDLYDIAYMDGTLPVVAPSGSFQVDIVEEAKEKSKNAQQEEENRLLYVAMTRAEDGLLIGGFTTSKNKCEDSFYQMVRSELERNFDVENHEEDKDIVLETHQIEAVEPQKILDKSHVEVISPAWLKTPAPPEKTPPRPLSPSRYAAIPPTHSPTGQERKKAMLRGSLTHRLLEILPGLDESARMRAAARIISPMVGLDKLSQDDADTALSETLHLIDHDELSGIFSQRSRAEVPISGRVGNNVVSGVIDRLVIDDDQIMIIDFKTGMSPERGVDINRSYIAQQGIYVRVLSQIWADRPVRAGLIYTEDASLYWLDGDEMREMIIALLDV